VFEVRVVVGRDPASGAGVQRSFTVRGDAELAEARRRELVADYGLDLSVLHASGITVGELLIRWFPRRTHLEAVDRGVAERRAWTRLVVRSEPTAGDVRATPWLGRPLRTPPRDRRRP
jgi:hypothetical protein